MMKAAKVCNRCGSSECTCVSRKYADGNIYNDPRYKRLRLVHLNEHPLCEDCLLQNKLTPATEIHHTTKVAGEKRNLLNPRYFMSICKRCHTIRTKDGQ